MPFIGETMQFSVNWEFVNAGSARMEIHAQPNGWQVKTYARTNKLLDLFKKVRDTITAEGICNNGDMQSRLFDADLHERKYRAQKRTEFLWQQNLVTYTQHNNTEKFDVPAGHLSVIDAFLKVRAQHLEAGKTLHIPIFDSRKTYELVVDVAPKTKLLRAPWGKGVRCIVVKPKLKTEGIFTQKGEMTLWMTDDARHIPLKINIKIKFGHIVVFLTKYHAGHVETTSSALTHNAS